MDAATGGLRLNRSSQIAHIQTAAGGIDLYRIAAGHIDRELRVCAPYTKPAEPAMCEASGHCDAVGILLRADLQLIRIAPVHVNHDFVRVPADDAHRSDVGVQREMPARWLGEALVKLLLRRNRNRC